MACPRKWVEIAPFVWRDVDSDDRLAAKVVDGKPVRWSMDFMSPFMVVRPRRRPSQSAAWIMPALYASLAILLLTVPVLADLLAGPPRITRRELAVAGRARQAYRATRLSPALALAVLIGWLLVVARDVRERLEPQRDRAIRGCGCCRSSALVVFVGAVAGRRLERCG